MSTDVQAAPVVPVAELREVQGPSALGGGRRRFFDLLWLISVTEFKRVYFGTVLGYLWSLLRPLMLFGVLLLIFTKVFKVGHDLEFYPVVLLLGIVLYGFFQEATTNSVTSVVAQEGVVRKTQFPRLVIPLSTVVTAIFNLGLNLIIVFVFILAWGVDPQWSWFLFPVALLFLFILTAAVSTALAALYVRFRDVSIIWVVLAQVLFYATPVLYPLGPNGLENRTFERLLMINPLAVIFEQIRHWVIEPSVAPTAVQAAGGWLYLLPAAVLFVGACGFGAWFFNREAPRIAEAL